MQWHRLWWIAGVVATSSCVPAKPPAPPAPQGPPREIAGELRRGDDTCPNLCDTHRFTWATATQVEIRADAPQLDVFLDATMPDGQEEQGDFGHTSVVQFTAQPGVEYVVAVKAYNYYDSGTYALSVTPAPSGEKLAEERPVWVPPTPEEEEPDDTLPAKIATLTTGWTASGKEVHGDLAKVPKMHWKAKRGRCYRAVVVMEAGARANDDWYLIHFLVETPAESRGSSGGFLTGSRRILSAGGDEGVCPSKSGAVDLTFEHRHKMTPLTDAGTGTFRVQLYEKAISGKELDDRDAADDDDYCASCMRQRLACQQTGDTGNQKTCEGQFSACLRDGGMKKSQCKP
jgi:hypothetical protein